MGEARHLGPPRRRLRQTTEEDEDHLFGDGRTPGDLSDDRIETDAVVDDLFLMAEPSGGVDVVELNDDRTQKSEGRETNLGELHVGLEMEFVSLMEVGVPAGVFRGCDDDDIHSKPYGRRDGKYT